MNATIEKLSAWLLEQSLMHQYGSVSVTVVIHAGKIVRCERAISESEKPDDLDNCQKKRMVPYVNRRSRA